MESARAERQLVGLLGQRLDDVRVAVALVDGAAGAGIVRSGLGELRCDETARRKAAKGPQKGGGYMERNGDVRVGREAVEVLIAL